MGERLGMRGQADLFLDFEAPPGPIETKPADGIVLRSKYRGKSSKAADYETAARMLEATGDYRVLRRLQPRPIAVLSAPLQGEKIAVIIDTETTGLNIVKDILCEIAAEEGLSFPLAIIQAEQDKVYLSRTG